MLKKTIHSLFISRRKELPFIILLSFLITFALTRLWVFTIYEFNLERTFFFYVFVEGKEYHIHHLSYGIVGISVLSFFSIAYPKVIERIPHISAMMYGIFLALILDEAALWLLDLDIKYTHRFSTDAVVMAVSILMLIVYFPPFWKWMYRFIRRKKDQKELPIEFKR
ncbi:MAG: hypothetical protein ACK4NC_00530 [Candidatus Gracilibacteria bacterium]